MIQDNIHSDEWLQDTERPLPWVWYYDHDAPHAHCTECRRYVITKRLIKGVCIYCKEKESQR